MRPQRRLKRLGSKAPTCANGSFQVGSDVSLGGGGLLPRCGFVNVQSGTMSVTPFALRLPKTPPLSLMCVHKSKLKVKKDGKTKVFSGKKKFASWSSIRCFSSTTTAVLRNPSPPGICDLANQIRYSTKFKEFLKEKKDCRYLNREVGEYLSGFPRGWTDPTPFAVCRGTFEKMFPHVSADVLTKNEGKIPVVSCFSGIAGLELGLARWVYPTTMAERDSACQKILRQRMSEGLLHKSRLVADVTKFQGGDDPEAEGCVGGFPCQDTSTAGLMCGMTGERSSMVKEI